MADEQYVVMTVECPTCKAKQKVYVASLAGVVGDRTIQCRRCGNHVGVAVTDKIIRGPFPV
jgi:hypothetical protein